MSKARWIGVVAAGGVLFSAGYALGQASAVLAALDKQPASMLTIGVGMAKLNYPSTDVTVAGDRLIVKRTTTLGVHDSTPTDAECATKLKFLRQELGVRRLKTASGELGEPTRSTFSLLFLSPVEQTSEAASVLNRRDAIDAATTVQLAFRRTQATVGCQGALKGDDSHPL